MGFTLPNHLVSRRSPLNRTREKQTTQESNLKKQSLIDAKGWVFAMSVKAKIIELRIVP